jgi:hypothetical protein
MPVDAKPTGKAVVLYNNPDHERDPDAPPLSRVVNAYVSHFATCPNAARHRSAPPKAPAE